MEYDTGPRSVRPFALHYAFCPVSSATLREIGYIASIDDLPVRYLGRVLMFAILFVEPQTRAFGSLICLATIEITGPEIINTYEIYSLV